VYSLIDFDTGEYVEGAMTISDAVALLAKYPLARVFDADTGAEIDMAPHLVPFATDSEVC